MIVNPIAIGGYYRHRKNGYVVQVGMIVINEQTGRTNVVHSRKTNKEIVRETCSLVYFRTNYIELVSTLKDINPDVSTTENKKSPEKGPEVTRPGVQESIGEGSISSSSSTTNTD